MGERNFVLRIDKDKMFVYKVLGDDLTKGEVVVERPEEIILNPEAYNARTKHNGISFKVKMYTLADVPMFNFEENISAITYSSNNINNPEDAYVIYNKEKNGCLDWMSGFSYGEMVVFYDWRKAEAFCEVNSERTKGCKIVKYTDVLQKELNEDTFDVIKLIGDCHEVFCYGNTIIQVSGETVIDLSDNSASIGKSSENKVPVFIGPDCRKIIIRGITKNAKVTMYSGLMQPCIGLPTGTGLSYGRYEVNSNKVNFAIDIDGVFVELHGGTENFTIGKYGSNDMPTIKYYNGGKLDCPETTGERYMTSVGEPPVGSTKISSKTEYAIDTSGDPNVDLKTELCSDKIKLYQKQLPKRFRNAVSMYTTDDGIEKAVELSALMPNFDLSLLLDRTDVNRATTCTVLRNNYMYNKNEWELETNKENVVMSYFGNVSFMFKAGEEKYSNALLIDLVCGFIDNGIIKNKNEVDYAEEFVYELIPSFAFNGWVKGDHYRSAKKYLESFGVKLQVYKYIQNAVDKELLLKRILYGLPSDEDDIAVRGTGISGLDEAINKMRG